MLSALRRWLWRGCLAGGGLLALGGPGAAQTPAAPVFRFARPTQRRARVPYQAPRNLIVVRACLNGLGPYNFVLDTGVNVSLLLDASLGDSLHLALGQRFRVLGTGVGAALDAYQVDGVQVALPGGVVGPAVSFLLLGPNNLNFSGFVGLPIRGILGADVFRSFVVAVNPGAAQLVLHDPARYQAPAGRRWTALPLAVDAGKPYVTAQVLTHDSATAALRLLLDTGAGHALSLDVSSDPALRFPSPRVRAPLGWGLSGEVTGYLGRTAAVQLGRYALASLITSFPDTSHQLCRPRAFEGFRNGSLGYEALSRFCAVIDYAHNRLLLKPGPRYRQPFEQDVLGLEVVARGPHFRRYQVALVQAGSPAAAAGLRVDDELLFVNFIPAASLSLTQLGELLRASAGHRLTLVVRRADGELSSAVLALKRAL